MGKSKHIGPVHLCTAAAYRKVPRAADSVYYAGQSYIEFHELSEQHPSIQTLPLIWDESIADFLVNIDSLMGNDARYAFCATAAHNRYLSGLPDIIVRALPLLAIARESRSTLIICESFAQIAIFKAFLRQNGVIANGMGSIIHRRLGQVRTFLRLITQACGYVRQARPTRLNFLYDKATWFITWPSAQATTEDYYTRNRYFGDMPHAQGGIEKVAILLRPQSGASFVRPDNPPSLCDAMTWKDIAWSLKTCLSLLGACRQSYRIKDVILDGIVRSSLFDDLCSGRFFETLLDYRAFQKISQLLQPDATVFYPFENQPWEKALLSAINGKARTKALQFFPMPEKLTMHRFSKHGLRPDTILTTDHTTTALFAGSAVTQPVQNMRYHRLLSTPLAHESKGKIAIASLFLDDAEAQETAVKAILVTREVGCQLWINFHPLTTPATKQAIRNYATQFEHVSLKEESLADLIDAAALVMYAQSSIGYEAALKGIPAIFITPVLTLPFDRMNGAALNFSDIPEGELIITRLLHDAAYSKEYIMRLHRFAANNVTHNTSQPMAHAR